MKRENLFDGIANIGDNMTKNNHEWVLAGFKLIIDKLKSIRDVHNQVTFALRINNSDIYKELYSNMNAGDYNTYKKIKKILSLCYWKTNHNTQQLYYMGIGTGALLVKCNNLLSSVLAVEAQIKENKNKHANSYADCFKELKKIHKVYLTIPMHEENTKDINFLLLAKG